MIAALLAIHTIGCTSSNDDAETPGAVLVNATPPAGSEIPANGIITVNFDIAPKSEYKETFLIAKLDSDRNRLTVQKYRIEAIPTFIVFRDGKIIGRFVGGMQKAPLLQRILQAVNTQGN